MKITSVRVYVEADEDPDLSWLNQTDEQMGEGFEKFASARRVAWECGDWDMVGVVAEATIEWDDVWSKDGQTCLARAGSETITTRTWNIESDSGHSCFRAVGADLLTYLRALLKLDDRTDHLTFSDSDVQWEI